MDYKLSINSVPVELSGGKPVAPGEVVTLHDNELKDPHNKLLVDSGLLMPVEEKKGGGK